MKKILAVVLSLAMILSMTVVGFAAEVPAVDADVEAWTAYYTEILMDETLDADAKLDALTTSAPADTTVMMNAIMDAMQAAEEAGVDTDELINAIMDKLEEDEDFAGEDLDGDGYIGTNKKPVDPTDVEGWTAYYAILLGEATTNPAAMVDVVAEIGGDIMSGAIDMDTFTSVLPEAAKIVGNDVVNQMVWGVESLIGMDLNGDGYKGKPDGSIEDGKLPEEDEGEGDSGSGIGGFLDTILGILGSIGDLLFGGSGGGDTPTTDPSEDDEDLWGDDGDDAWGDDSDSTIPDTGDTTVFAVAAVALVAGAALVMTRKKSEDAE